jgi:hypothetical protein
MKHMSSNRHRWIFRTALFAGGVVASALHAGGGKGDFDGDCDVDLADFGAFQLCFSGPGGSVGKTCSSGDFDGDDDVDLVDFNSFQLAFSGPVSSGAAADLELAGNELSAFPFFEYVRSFSVGVGMSVAIDPNLNPELAGQSCDLYVVISKSAADWSADASVEDVRAGGAQSVLFTGGTIQENTFSVAESTSLSGVSGGDLGVAYDLVLDCNHDGMLGCGDFVDGGGDEAGMYVVQDLTQPGPYPVSNRDYVIELLPTGSPGPREGPLGFGACCWAEGGECTDWPESTCDTIGGVWHGPRTECSTTVCDVPPGLGACCNQFGGCSHVAESSCLPGFWEGTGVSCSIAGCEPVDFGACCSPDGMFCNETTMDTCLGPFSGDWHGVGTSCGEITCEIPEGFGACCRPGLPCNILMEKDCIAKQGAWQGDGISCGDVECLLGRQRLYYPTHISSMTPRPLVVIGHGSGHDYSWYEYLQSHLASYGYVVVSHTNLFTFGNGTQDVIRHTDAFLENLDTIAGGALLGNVDSSRIVWAGHSLGGQEVVVAIDTLFDGMSTPKNFSINDLNLVSGIAAASDVGPDRADPHNVPYHMIWGSADGDISGSPGCGSCFPFQHLDRAIGWRQSTYIHGADHNDFNCCGFDDFQGPAETEIGRFETQRVAKAVYLALLKHYTESDPAAKDFLWRQWERFRPIGVAESTTVVSTFHEASASDDFVIDDFQTNFESDASSSGGAVTFNVTSLVEDVLRDGDITYQWLDSDMMNGMTHAGAKDDSRGVSFEWSGGAFLSFALVPGARDLSAYDYLSFRACQMTRHPLTVAELGDLTFEVSLVDGAGHRSGINIGAYGGGLEEPYQRQGGGGVAGWLNEFETIRIRVRDFLNNGSALDLLDVVEFRFDFGDEFSSAGGRIGLDDLELIAE